MPRGTSPSRSKTNKPKTPKTPKTPRATSSKSAPATRGYRGLNNVEAAIVVWFCISGFIHLFFEGTYVVFEDEVAKSDGALYYDDLSNYWDNFAPKDVHPAMAVLPSVKNYFLAGWKEYTCGDARYLRKDPFVWCMEFVTAFFDGPMCFLAAYAFLGNRSWKHLVALFVCIAELYGDVLYYGTEVVHGMLDTDTSSIKCFWVYFGFMNFIWIVIPLLITVYSCKHVSRAFTRLRALEDRLLACDDVALSEDIRDTPVQFDMSRDFFTGVPGFTLVIGTVFFVTASVLTNLADKHGLMD